LVITPRNYYESADQIEAVVRGFEDCTLPDSQFKHAEHLVVALSYFHHLRLTVPEATKRLRAALYRFLDHHAGERQAYNETITRFWIELVHSFLKRIDPSRPVQEIANEMIETYGSSNLIHDYFSRELLLSREAKEAWVEPDLKPLDF
jgi:hypothetical protein